MYISILTVLPLFVNFRFDGDGRLIIAPYIIEKVFLIPTAEIIRARSYNPASPSIIIPSERVKSVRCFQP